MQQKRKWEESEFTTGPNGRADEPNSNDGQSCDVDVEDKEPATKTQIGDKSDIKQHNEEELRNLVETFFNTNETIDRRNEACLELLPTLKMISKEESESKYKALYEFIAHKLVAHLTTLQKPPTTNTNNNKAKRLKSTHKDPLQQLDPRDIPEPGPERKFKTSLRDLVLVGTSVLQTIYQ